MDKQELSNLILGDDPHKREKWFKLFEDPVWKPRYNMDWETTRDEPFKKLRFVQKSGIVSVKDFFTDPKNIFLAHEMISQLDGATVTKFTVQYNLFGGSMTALHTERHAHFFDKIDSGEVIGCFCLTELGFGNNAIKMETTVTYDDMTQEFILNSPTVMSQKYWITNGFKHSNWALVFGQTIVKGKNEGVAAFLVQIRDKNMKEMPGVQIIDMGLKIGQNGVDNAALKFDKVRIPRTNMMNKFSEVDEKGNFKSKFASPSSRFFGTTEKLLSGRICIASMAVGAARACLYIAITYAKQRMAVGQTGESDTPIFNYQLQQNALMPLLARTVALSLLHVKCKDIYQKPKGFENELLSLCCIDKTLNGWNLERVASICRERCGGQGYLSHNKFADYISIAHAGLTAEGDNRVLMVKICKDMITNITKKGHKLPQMQNCPFRHTAKLGDISSLETLLDLLKFRETFLFGKLTSDIKNLTPKVGAYNVLMQETSDVMQNLAQTYGERHALEYCIQQLSVLKNEKNREVMALCFRLFGAEVINRDLGFYMLQGVVNTEAAKALTQIRHEIIKKVASNAVDILDCLNIPKHALYAPIAGDYVKYNSSPNYGEIVGSRL